MIDLWIFDFLKNSLRFSEIPTVGISCREISEETWGIFEEIHQQDLEDWRIHRENFEGPLGRFLINNNFWQNLQSNYLRSLWRNSLQYFWTNNSLTNLTESFEIVLEELFKKFLNIIFERFFLEVPVGILGEFSINNFGGISEKTYVMISSGISEGISVYQTAAY